MDEKTVKQIEEKGSHITIGEDVLLMAHKQMGPYAIKEHFGINEDNPKYNSIGMMFAAALEIINRCYSPESYISKNTVFEWILELLNEAFKADPVAIHSLICNRVPCNKALADHPNISVSANPVLEETQYTVSMLGILVGLSERITGKRIAIKFVGTERPKLLGFCEFNPPKEGE